MFDTRPAPPPVPVPVQRGTVQREGIGLSWRRYGRLGRSLAFVPPWHLFSARAWGQLLPYFAEDHWVLSYDPRGAGESDRTEVGFGLYDRIEDAAVVARAAGAGACTWVAAWRGAATAIGLALRHPQLVNALVLVAPELTVDAVPQPFTTATGASSLDDAELLRRWPEGVRAWLEAAFSEPNSADLRRDFAQIASSASRRAVLASLRDDAVSYGGVRLADVRCPVLVVHGRDDRLVAPADIESLASSGNVRVEWLDRAGHAPFARHPERVAMLIADFERSLAPGA